MEKHTYQYPTMCKSDANVYSTNSVVDELSYAATKAVPISLSTVVLNSRDRYETLWLPEFSHF